MNISTDIFGYQKLYDKHFAPKEYKKEYEHCVRLLESIVNQSPQPEDAANNAKREIRQLAALKNDTRNFLKNKKLSPSDEAIWMQLIKLIDQLIEERQKI